MTVDRRGVPGIPGGDRNVKKASKRGRPERQIRARQESRGEGTGTPLEIHACVSQHALFDLANAFIMSKNQTLTKLLLCARHSLCFPS